MSRRKTSSTVEVLSDDALSELWADVDKVIKKYELPEPGDITREMIAERYNISPQAAKDRIKKLVRTGEWEQVWVKRGNGDRPRTVLRKKNANQV